MDSVELPVSPSDGAQCLERSSFVVHGVFIELIAGEPHVLERAAARLPVGAQRAQAAFVDASYVLSKHPSEALYALAVDGEHVSGPGSLSEALAMFESHVTLRVAERAPQHVFVHAGVVSWRGRGILFPGYSFSGKTTLVAALVRAGALYYSDEYAVLGSGGHVYPYPRPLQMREPGTHRQTPVPVNRLGGIAGDGPLAVDLVVLCRYKPGANWRPRKISPGRAALEMFAYTMCAQRAPEAALSTLQRVVATASLLKGTRGEAGQLISFIAKTFEG
jgi:hypothetical protein